jgi:hypothetical protein
MLASPPPARWPWTSASARRGQDRGRPRAGRGQRCRLGRGRVPVHVGDRGRRGDRPRRAGSSGPCSSATGWPPSADPGNARPPPKRGRSVRDPLRCGQGMRRLAVVAVVVCLAVGVWWMTTPRTARQAVGWCVQRQGREVWFVWCLPGTGGKVVGSSPQLFDIMGTESRFGPYCPRKTDKLARSPFRSGD